MKIDINKVKKIINFEVKENPLKSNQNKALKILVYFLIVMILCTFLSRFSNSLTVPKVHVVHPTESQITHDLNARGTIEESNEIPVTTMSGLMVTNVNVGPSDTVKKGDTLLTFSEDSVKSKINEANKALAVKRTAYNRAVEDYNQAQSDAKKAQEEAKNAVKAPDDEEGNETANSNNEFSAINSSNDDILVKKEL